MKALESPDCSICSCLDISHWHFYDGVWKLLWEKLLKVRVDFSSPNSLFYFILGCRADLCIMEIPNISLSLFCPLLQLKGTSGIKTPSVQSHQNYRRLHTYKLHYHGKKVPLCAPHTSLQCGIGFPDTPSRLLWDCFNNIILHSLTATITTCLDHCEPARAH